MTVMQTFEKSYVDNPWAGIPERDHTIEDITFSAYGGKIAFVEYDAITKYWPPHVETWWERWTRKLREWLRRKFPRVFPPEVVYNEEENDL